MSFANKIILLTGASSGIGAVTATKFASKGADLAIIGRNEEKLNIVHEKIKNIGKRSLPIIADLTEDNKTTEIVRKTIDHFGKLDVLVNVAGIAKFESILSENAVEIFDQVMDINLRATVKLTNVAAKHLIKTKGNIVNISSIGSLGVLNETNFAYCTSKAGLDHFTRSIAVELSKYGVRVNTVNPGPVDTNGLNILDENELKRFKDVLKNSSLLGKLIKAEEVADLILFLSSDKAKSVTGSSFVIDNGVLLNDVIVN